MSENNYRGNRYGHAGKSLGGDGAVKKFGKTTKAGARGERYLASMFNGNSDTKRYMTWASLRIPRIGRGKQYSSDVDFAIASGKTLILIDAKQWSAGNFYWSAFGRVFKNMSVFSDKLSQNMELAVNSYRDKLPDHRVIGMVVFTPTPGGLPSGVGLLRWPGGIKSYLPNDGLRKVRKLLGEAEAPSADIQSVCGNMTR